MAYGAAQVDFTYQQEFWICLSVCVCVYVWAYPQDVMFSIGQSLVASWKILCEDLRRMLYLNRDPCVCFSLVSDILSHT